MDLVEYQTGLGCRVPGASAHEQLTTFLMKECRACADEVYRQSFSIFLKGQLVECTNVAARFFGANGKGTNGREPGSQPAAEPGATDNTRKEDGPGPRLIGTHYDTRLIADNEADPAERTRPIPGANDGGSGTAVLISLLRRFRWDPPPYDTVLVFFDAEDVGNIGVNRFSEGAYWFVDHPVPSLPEEALILDMVGGRSPKWWIDLHCLYHEPSLLLTQRFFRFAGTRPGGAAAGFSGDSSIYRKGFVISDHYPFFLQGIPAVILIDLGYPQWHTHQDKPGAMDEGVLRGVRDTCEAFLRRPRE
ncbi:MAG: M28 family peptidase [Spirochaetales bacterium]|nr:M28 family peptidase [Spirochaetales bacterium]MCF7937166.1 M28 family peptidase [Spirochaetales bacterium]